MTNVLLIPFDSSYILSVDYFKDQCGLHNPLIVATYYVLSTPMTNVLLIPFDSSYILCVDYFMDQCGPHNPLIVAT